LKRGSHQDKRNSLLQYQNSRSGATSEGAGFVTAPHSAATRFVGLSLAFPGGLVFRGIAGDNLPVVYQLLSRLP